MTGQQSPEDAAKAYDTRVSGIVGDDKTDDGADPWSTSRCRHAAAAAGGTTAPAAAAGPARRALPRIVPLAPGRRPAARLPARPDRLRRSTGSLTNTALTGLQGGEPGVRRVRELHRRCSPSPDFPKSVWLTLVFVVALGRDRPERARPGPRRCSCASAAKPMRSSSARLVVAAWVLPEIVAAFALYAFFSTDGTLNAMLGWFGIAEHDAGSSRSRCSSVILANIWRGHGLLDAGLRRRAQRGAAGDHRGRRDRRRERVPAVLPHHAADDPPDHLDQPHAHHPADARRLHPHLRDDRRRPGHRRARRCRCWPTRRRSSSRSSATAPRSRPSRCVRRRDLLDRLHPALKPEVD